MTDCRRPAAAVRPRADHRARAAARHAGQADRAAAGARRDRGRHPARPHDLGHPHHRNAVPAHADPAADRARRPRPGLLHVRGRLRGRPRPGQGPRPGRGRRGARLDHRAAGARHGAGRLVRAPVPPARHDVVRVVPRHRDGDHRLPGARADPVRPRPAPDQGRRPRARRRLGRRRARLGVARRRDRGRGRGRRAQPAQAGASPGLRGGDDLAGQARAAQAGRDL